MTFIITAPCIDTTDQACVSVCPVDCIHFEEGKDRMLYINPAECIDCGACQPACPVSAIFPEGDVPADQARFIEINPLWYEDPEAARAQVGGGGAPAAAPAATEASPTAEADAPAATASTDASAVAPAPEATPAAPPKPKPAPAGSFKFGENGVEGKCVLCGTYVIKSGVPYGRKSVLCPDCAGRQTRLMEQAGRR